VTEQAVDAGGEKGGLAVGTGAVGFEEGQVGVDGVSGPVGDRLRIGVRAGGQPVAGDGGQLLAVLVGMNRLSVLW